MTTFRGLLSGIAIATCFLFSPAAEASEDWAEEDLEPLPWTMTAQGGVAFRMLGAVPEPDVGTTYRVGFGIAAPDASLVFRLEVDEYYTLSTSEFWSLRPGASFAITMGDSGYPIRPVLTGDMGAYFDSAPSGGETSGGAAFDLGGGIAYQLEPGLNVRFTYSLGLLLASETDEFGETSLEFEGLRQSLTAGIQFIF